MNLYQSLYDLINTYVFGGSIVAESAQDLVTTLMSLGGTIFLVAVPFLVVWKIIKVLGGR